MAVEKVSLAIAGREFVNWSNLEIAYSLDTNFKLEFSAPFEPDNAAFRALFRPFTYFPIELRVADELLFVGTMVGVDPETDSESRTVKVSAYSRPGVLEDCTAQASAFPLEFSKLGLLAIASTLTGYFGFLAQIEPPADEGAKFDKVALDPEKKVHEFLTELAKQRSLVLSSTRDGQLLFRQAVSPGSPVARFVQGVPPLTSVQAKFSPQDYYSELTGISSARSGRNGGKYTQPNPRLIPKQTPKGKTKQRELVGLAAGLDVPVLRPLTVKLDDTEISDVPRAVSAKLGRMLGNMVAYTIEDLPTWRDPSGQLWRENTTVTLTAPDAMVYLETELLIRNVMLKQDAESETATLELVLPGSFSGVLPDRFPWDEE